MIGETVTSEVMIRVCKRCQCVIDETGLCNYGCPFDALDSRPCGTVIARFWRRTDTLVAELEAV